MKILDVLLMLSILISFVPVLMELAVIHLAEKGTQLFGETWVNLQLTRAFWSLIRPSTRVAILGVFSLILGGLEFVAGSLHLEGTSEMLYLTIPLFLVVLYKKGFFGGYVEAEEEIPLGIGV